MKVLLLAHATPLARDRVVSGNSVRAYYLARGLAEAGCSVLHVYPWSIDHAAGVDVLPVRGRSVVRYRDRAELRGVFAKWKPDAVLVGYWELLDQVPAEFHGPVIADVVAPRILETRFQGQPIEQEAGRLLRHYRRADWFLCGTERQRHLLLAWLLIAGFDCRQTIPIDVAPISSQPMRRRRRGPGVAGWRFVAGGVSWPWRQSERYIEALVRQFEQKSVNARLLYLDGDYVYNASEARVRTTRSQIGSANRFVDRMPLLPYGAMERLFRTECHIGLDVGEHNVEREYSLSFRSIEWLRCGIPIICDDYAEMATHVRTYDAGWAVASPAELAKVVRAIARSRGEWQLKSANALRLVKEHFHYRRTVRPILNYLRSPIRLAKGPPAFALH